ncbi:DAK2 domain-containing protein [Oribacterium sp. oral taxon 102]|uniref:DAK2 domain-containing protein n=1 Tax=Oribacterium sp. oral taxon 102 TaxID=671214 RepID=UPI0015BEEABB|nr:DAK2 domain-containing protein [Oribacterium sp. oral taxon 102]
MGNQINAKELQDAFLAAAVNLNAKKDYINELNVFPVPDGDTGTNMTMTILSAAAMVQEIAEPTVDNVSRAMASGSLRGARGNSGVILSQLIRGFTKELRECGETVDSLTLARAFNRAVETAYKAVMKPKEGTILTVAKGMAERITALSVNEEDCISLLGKVLDYGDEVLEKTPEMLPVLKEAGVVDSGGQGLMCVLRGALASLRGEKVEGSLTLHADSSAEGAPSLGTERVSRGEISTADIRFGYCTEFMVNGDHEFTDEEVEKLKEWLNGVGDSIVCFSDENVIKVHVHTNHPGDAFEKGLTMGYLSKMKVDNMRLEHHETLIKDASKLAAMEKLAAERKMAEPEKEFGFIAVSAGDGLKEIFTGIGVDYVISGGQTMNPSTEDILKAVEAVNAKHIFILPNNKNIILAANQAAELVTDKELLVIPTKTIPQGITAMIGYDSEASAEANRAAMTENIGSVASAEITYAVRNTTIDGHTIREGDIMCLGDHGLLSVEKTIPEAAKTALRKLVKEDSEIMTLYYGRDTEVSAAEALKRELQESFPGVEVELQNGGQPVYYYFISVE